MVVTGCGQMAGVVIYQSDKYREETGTSISFSIGVFICFATHASLYL